MKKRIFINDWLDVKPYNNHSKTDTYYLSIANKIYKIFNSRIANNFFGNSLNKKDYVLISCLLVSYFEDIISETNFFISFKNKHNELYKKKLPFFEVSIDYIDDEINAEDVQFLVWYFISTLTSNKFFNPHHLSIKLLSFEVMSVFEDEYEYAPQNTQLQNFYKIDAQEKNFYLIREYIDKVLFTNYLFYTDCFLDLNKEETNILENKDNKGYLVEMLRDYHDNAVFSTYTRLLSMKGKEWAGEILGRNHPLYNDILSVSNKVIGFFLYKGQDSENIFLEHIATNMKFNLTKKSYSAIKDFKNIDDIVYIGMALWKNEWWFSGISVVNEYDQEMIQKEKKSIESKLALNFLSSKEDKKLNEEILSNQFTAFKKITNGKLIVLMKTSEVKQFIDKFLEHYNNLDLTEEINDATSINYEEISSDYNPNDVEEASLVFFDSKKGITSVDGINDLFLVKENSSYNENDYKSLFLSLLMNKTISDELVKYYIENYSNVLNFYGEYLEEVITPDLDFLLRFYKVEEYHNVAQIVFKD